MKKIIDKYQIYIEIICGLFGGLYIYFSESLVSSESVVLDEWGFKYIFSPICCILIGWQFFGGITILVLRLIAYVFGDLKWQDFWNSYDVNEDLDNKNRVFILFAILIGAPLAMIGIAVVLFIIFIPYLCIHLFIEFVINKQYIFSNREFFLYIILEYLLLISFVDLIRYVGYKNKIKPMTLIASLVGLLLIVSNLFYWPSLKVELLGEFDKLNITIRSLFGIVFIIFPWLLDYTWKSDKFESIFRKIKN